jgi:lysophospholipase L1-like esterase
MTTLKYTFGSLLAIPFLPLLYYQGKRIRKSVPKLPEASGETGTSKPPIDTQQRLRLITIGESTIAGVGVATHQEGFTGTLAQELAGLLQRQIDWKVYARSGYTAQKVAEVIVPQIEEERVDLIVVGLGGNDAFHLHSPSRWRKGIIRLIEGLRAKYPSTPIVFCNMPPIKEFPAFTPLVKLTIGNLVELLGQELRTIVKAYEQVYYYGEIISLDGWVDRIPAGATHADFFSDGVHPSKLTYQTWAKDMAGKIATEKQLVDKL